jgi:hypothetical protein
MKERKCSPEMVNSFTKNWTAFVGDCKNTTFTKGYRRHTLGSGQYLSDVIHDIVDDFPKPSTI